ncbi:MAG: CCA tRNA nucleotidyltransferase [Bryobacteraceae bacterium]|nr:CCA tRNA nucleotidyltransferase [Bryobacteraceae bacterium]MDW8377119.1 CCA tRNA nucleotidyltransferase [Bryobacterales bacterium]
MQSIAVFSYVNPSGMEGSSQPQPPAWSAALRIVERLRQHGYQALFVGGCVRDQLLNIPPKDFDVATDARPEELKQLFPQASLVGAHFGVILVDGVQVATFRSDLAYADGRHPTAVQFETELRPDALRRDFTINALFLDPLTGQLYDFVGGEADLRAGLVRAVGDPVARFSEDHLRLLRAVRFAARFGFQIEAQTHAAIRQLHPLIRRVAPERVREELLMILTEGAARRGMELLLDCGLLAEILPEVVALRGVEQPPEFHPEGDVWTHVLLMLEKMGKAPPELALAVLLHDIGKPATFRIAGRIRFDGHVEVGVQMSREILARLRCSNQMIERVTALVKHHMRFKDLPRMKESTLKRFLRLPDFELHLELHRLDCLASHQQLGTYELARRLFNQLAPEQLRPPRLLSGRDLIAAGYEPGPVFGKILQAVEDAQLEGRIHTRDEALALAKQLAAPAESPLQPAGL